MNVLFGLVHKRATGYSSDTRLANQKFVQLAGVFKSLGDSNPRIETRSRRVDLKAYRPERLSNDRPLARKVDSKTIVVVGISKQHSSQRVLQRRGRADIINVAELSQLAYQFSRPKRVTQPPA